MVCAIGSTYARAETGSYFGIDAPAGTWVEHGGIYAYVNNRFEFKVAYSAALFGLGEEADNHDGITATSADGSAQLLAFGDYYPTVENKTLTDYFKEDVGNSAYKVTYSHIDLNHGVYVVSGFEAGRIFYFKTYVIDGIQYRLEIRYEIRDRSTYDAQVGAIAKSFGPK